MIATRVRRGVAFVAVLALGGCASAPPQPESMLDRSVDFNSFQTFGWAPSPGVNGTDQPLMMVDQSIRSAIAAEMRRRGYSESAQDPDLRLAYETSSAEKVESRPVRIGIGVGSWGGSGGASVSSGSPSVRSYRESTLVIHAIDAARNAEVWQGRISTRLTPGSTGTAAVTTAVQAAMRDFPVRTGP
jgi:hypothetical protein